MEPPSFHTVLGPEAVHGLSLINLDRFGSILANVIAFRINSDPSGASPWPHQLSLVLIPTVLSLSSFPRQLRFGLWHPSRYPPESYYRFLTSQLYRPRRSPIISLIFATFHFSDQAIDRADLVCNEKPFFHLFGVLVDVCITYGEIRFDARATDTCERNFHRFLFRLAWEPSFA